jgi:hypothetical protein
MEPAGAVISGQEVSLDMPTMGVKSPGGRPCYEAEYSPGNVRERIASGNCQPATFDE